MSSIFWHFGRLIELFLLLLVLRGLLPEIIHVTGRYTVGWRGVVPFKSDLGPLTWGTGLCKPEQWVKGVLWPSPAETTPPASCSQRTWHLLRVRPEAGGGVPVPGGGGLRHFPAHSFPPSPSGGGPAMPPMTLGHSGIIAETFPHEEGSTVTYVGYKGKSEVRLEVHVQPMWLGQGK